MELNAYYIDTSPFKDEKKGNITRDNFEPERFMKDNEDIELCETLIKQNFKYFQALYLQCLAQSNNYPEIDQ